MLAKAGGLWAQSAADGQNRAVLAGVLVARAAQARDFRIVSGWLPPGQRGLCPSRDV